jgi:predicted nucleic acid-binding protein
MDEFLTTLLESITAYSSTKNEFGQVLEFMKDIYELSSQDVRGLNNYDTLNVGQVLLASGNSEAIGETDWNRMCQAMVLA